jgi:hypothetical protein
MFPIPRPARDWSIEIGRSANGFSMRMLTALRRDS